MPTTAFIREKKVIQVFLRTKESPGSGNISVWETTAKVCMTVPVRRGLRLMTSWHHIWITCRKILRKTRTILILVIITFMIRIIMLLSRRRQLNRERPAAVQQQLQRWFLVFIARNTHLKILRETPVMEATNGVILLILIGHCIRIPDEA